MKIRFAVAFAIGSIGLAACTVDDATTAVVPVTRQDVPSLPLCDVTTSAEPIINVGHGTYDHTYTVPWSKAERTIEIHYWYPTSDATGDNPAYQGIFPFGRSFDDATFGMAGQNCRMPTYVYSHGSQGFSGSVISTVDDLIKKGWIVIAPNHTGNTLTDNIDPRPQDFELLRASDMVQTMDSLDTDSAPTQLALYADTTTVVVGGHSYGGNTSWLMAGMPLDADAMQAKCDATPETCVESAIAAYRNWGHDKRVAGIVAMDGNIGPSFITDSSVAKKAVPALIMTTEDRREGGYYLYDNADSDISIVTFEGGCHESFTATDTGCDTLEKETGLIAVRQYLVAFLKRWTLNDQSDDVIKILNGQQKVAEFTTIDAK